jgi:hypothetical protein
MTRPIDKLRAELDEALVRHRRGRLLDHTVTDILEALKGFYAEDAKPAPSPEHETQADRDAAYASAFGCESVDGMGGPPPTRSAPVGRPGGTTWAHVEAFSAQLDLFEATHPDVVAHVGELKAPCEHVWMPGGDGAFCEYTRLCVKCGKGEAPS